MTWAAVAGGTIAAAGTIGSSFLSGGSSGGASEEALAWAKKQFKMQLAEYHAQIAREQPFRDAALEREQFGTSMLPMVRDRIDNPTLSPGFDLASKRGLDALRASYSTNGSPSSGPSQVAGARFEEGLANDELSRFNSNLFTAAGFRGTAPASQGPAYLGIAAGTGNEIPGLIQNQGNVQAGTYDSIGNTLSQFGLLTSGLFKKPPGGASGTLSDYQSVSPLAYNPYQGIAY